MYKSHCCDEFEFAEGYNSGSYNLICIRRYKGSDYWTLSVEHVYDNEYYFNTDVKYIKYCPFCGEKLK